MGMTCVLYAMRPEEDRDDPDFDALGSDPNRYVDIQKSWHGLHFLLTGDAWGGAFPAGFLAAGGEEVGGDLGYGPARYLQPEEVRALRGYLDGVSGDALWQNYDAAAMNENEIYPLIWDEDEQELREEYLGYYEELRAFLRRTAETGQGVLITLT